MKKIGLVGGTSWTSTLDYYTFLNQETNKILGGLHYAECIIYSINFHDFQKANAVYDWEATYNLMMKAAEHLQNAGAELLMLGANTAHIVADKISDQLKIPLIDIRITTARAVEAKGIFNVGLLGTKYTMELEFYKDKLAENKINVLTPSLQSERDFIEETLLHELGKGILRSETKKEYLRITDNLIQQGAEGIILGCTEIPLLLSQADIAVPVFNTTQIHAQAAVQYALASNYHL